jgi:hypothetical protein
MNPTKKKENANKIRKLMGQSRNTVKPALVTTSIKLHVHRKLKR